MQYLGDYAEDYATLNFKFSTHKADGTPATLSGTPAISVYKANGTTQSTAGIILTADFDSVTGLNNVLFDLSADAFYAVANDYSVVITTGTVDSVSVVGTVLAHFSIENRFNEVDVTKIGGATQSATDLKDFADSGYDPSTHKVQGVVLTDTCTTNTDMRGTNSALLAANYTAPNNSGITDIKAKTDQLTFTTVNKVDATATVDMGDLATAANQTTIINHLTDVKGATFSGSTDSLEAIRNRGDVAWITGGTGGGSNVVTINVKASAVNVVDCYVEIWDSAGTSFISRTTTNSSGNVSFDLDNGTYTVKMHKAGYYFANQTLTVDGVESVAYTGTILTPTAPTDPTLCKVYGYYFDPSGNTFPSIKSMVKISVAYEAADNNYYLESLNGTYNTTTGELSFNIIQGATAILDIPFLNIKKQFTVPAETLYKISDII